MENKDCEYQNDGERITAPGAFEGEPVFAPHYWGLAMEGFADRDNGQVFTFRFAFATTDASAKFRHELEKWLGRKRTLNMRQDDSGFIHCF